MQFPGVMDFVKRYQARAPAEGVDPLGYFLPPFAYAELQILAQAVEAIKTLDQDKLADYIPPHDFQHHRRRRHVRPGGRMDKGAAIWVQYHDIKGSDIAQFREPNTVAILSPPEYKTGDLIWPYTKARGA